MPAIEQDQSFPDFVDAFVRQVSGLSDAPVISRLKGGRTSPVFLARLPQRSVSLVVKVSFDGDGTLLFDNRPKDEWRILNELSPYGVSPMPVGHMELSDGTQVLGYQFVQGHPGARSSRALAGLLAAIHAHNTHLHLPSRPITPEALLAEAGALCSAPLPAWTTALRPQIVEVAPLDRLRFVHRDPIASNIVTDTRNLPVLIDWQCPAYGDPLEDIAHATSPAMAHVYGSETPFAPEEVLDYYPCKTVRARARHLLPVYRWRMLCYCGWQVAQGHQAYQKGMELEAEALERLNSKKNSSG